MHIAKTISIIDWIYYEEFNQPYPLIYINGGSLDRLQIDSRVNLVDFANKFH